MRFSKLALLAFGLFQTTIAIEQKYHVITLVPQNACDISVW